MIGIWLDVLLSIYYHHSWLHIYLHHSVWLTIVVSLTFTSNFASVSILFNLHGSYRPNFYVSFSKTCVSGSLSQTWVSNVTTSPLTTTISIQQSSCSTIRSQNCKGENGENGWADWCFTAARCRYYRSLWWRGWLSEMWRNWGSLRRNQASRVSLETGTSRHATLTSGQFHPPHTIPGWSQRAGIRTT